MAMMNDKDENTKTSINVKDNYNHFNSKHDYTYIIACSLHSVLHRSHT